MFQRRYGKGRFTCDQHRRVEITEIVLEIGEKVFQNSVGKGGASGGNSVKIFSHPHGSIKIVGFLFSRDQYSSGE
jgi:hypothetical protein